MTTVQDKFQLQKDQYEFPYHHIPCFGRSGDGIRFRAMTWGFEYLCYQRHLIELVGHLQPKSVLEVGCGDGVFIGSLSDVPRRVGVDLVARSIAFAKAFNPEVEFAAMDAAELDETFELVAAIEVLEHIPDDLMPSFVETLHARIQPGGRLLISVPTKVVPFHPKHYRHYDLARLEAQFAEAGDLFQTERVEYVYGEDWLVRAYRRLTSNRLWFVEIKPLAVAIWRHIWSRLRYSNQAKGWHLVATLQRREDV